MFNSFLDSKKDEMLNSLSNIISFPSISIPSSNSSYPFGKACTDVLDYTLNLGRELGFRVKNIDGYCGYIEFGEGDEILGIIGHLDVVPADDNWTYPPFKATINDGKLFGRGAIDDKGPVIASLYAMKAIMDTIKVNKRVRLILGLNEEKDWECINYYKAHEESPTIGFSPDADFPCIYAEKGILTVFIKQKLEELPIKIINIDTNNNAINVVPKYCKVTLGINSRYNTEEVNSYINEIINDEKLNMNSIINNGNIEITSIGVAAHSAHPDLGINSISNLIVLLDNLYKHYNIKYSILDLFNKYINTEYNGKSLNINYTDESGSLTLNVGDFSISEEFIQIGLNLRIPITISLDNVSNTFYKLSDEFSNISINITGEKEPLYIDKENSLITTLCNIYNEFTNSNAKPIPIGGATYARAFKNCVSFGANFPGDKDMCHQVDEYISIDKLLLSSKIYAKAIYELAKE